MNPDARQRLLDAVARAPAPARAAVRRRNAIATALGFVPLLAVFQYVGGVVIGQRPSGWLALLAVSWSLLAVATTWSALGSGGSMLGRPRASVLATAPGAPVLL